MVRLLVVLGLLAAVGGGAWWLLREPPLKPGELRVTYKHGESCRWQDWTFKVRRRNQNNTVRGNVLIAGGYNVEVREDRALRVYSPEGDKLFFQPRHLRQMEFVTRASETNQSRDTVVSLDLVTDSGTTRFVPVELPKFSRSRVMVPVAVRYFPDQSDDYMTWGNVRLTLAGTAPPECSTDREISLTRSDHSNQRTPSLIEFGY